MALLLQHTQHRRRRARRQQRIHRRFAAPLLDARRITALCSRGPEIEASAEETHQTLGCLEIRPGRRVERCVGIGGRLLQPQLTAARVQ